MRVLACVWCGKCQVNDSSGGHYCSLERVRMRVKMPEPSDARPRRKAWQHRGGASLDTQAWPQTNSRGVAISATPGQRVSLLDNTVSRTASVVRPMSLLQLLPPDQCWDRTSLVATNDRLLDVKPGQSTELYFNVDRVSTLDREMHNVPG